MSNIRLIPQNRADSATISASSTASGYVAENLQSSRRTTRWRSTITSATLTVTFATAQSIDSVALMRGNLTNTATWRVRLYDAGSALLYDSGVGQASPSSWANSQSILWVPQPYTTKSIVIDLVDSSNPNGYIEISRLVAGLRWEPAINAAWGAKLMLSSADVQARAEDGTMFSEKRSLSREVSFDLDTLAETDRSALINLMATAGLTTDFLVSLYPSDSNVDREHQHMMMGKFSGNLSSVAASFGVFSAQVEVKEA